MKISSIITFILTLLFSILGIIVSLNMEVVLKSGTVYAICFALLTLVTIVIFIAGLKNMHKLFRIFSIILIIVPVLMFFIGRHFAKLDYFIHPNLAIKSNAPIIFLITLIIAFMFGVINTILAFTKTKIA